MPPKPTPISWQYVVLAALAAGFFLGIFVLIPDDQPTMRSGLIGLLVALGNAVILHFLSGVKKQVNGRMSKLLGELERVRDENADLKAGAAVDLHRRNVSRETSEGKS